jgi:hypothetical protein
VTDPEPTLGRSKWRVRLALLLAGVVIAVALADLVARVALGPRFEFRAFVGPPQAICGEFDAELGWRNRPDTSVDIAARGFRYHVTINSRGQRGPEREHAKPAGVRRVVLLGDSTAWGWGVDDTEAWPRLVEAELGGAVEIVNLAVPGYGTDQELWALERDGLAYAPDLVLLAFVHNDVMSNNGAVMQGMAKPQLVRDPGSRAWTVANRPVPPPKSGSELENRRLRRVLSMYSGLAAAFEPPPPQPTRIDVDDPKVRAVIERQWNQLVDPEFASCELLGRVQRAASGAGAPMLAFVFPHLVDRYLYDPEAPAPEHDPSQPFETLGTRKLADAGRMHGFATFSVDAALLAETRQGVNLDCGDEHLNARGNRVVAGVVAERLRQWLAGH